MKGKKIPVTAVFDIGKTNKKFLLFDEEYNIVFKQQTVLDETEDEDGDPCENLEQLVRWVRQKFETALHNDEFEVRSLNFSTYGATLVHLDKQGDPVTPLYNYLKAYPEELQQELYSRFGGRRNFSIETASPPMGMLNSGLQLYWLKHRKPAKFGRVSHSLHFPQYLSYLFTGQFYAELTSIGCHTALWNYEENSYHRWLDQEDMLKFLAEVEPVDKSFSVMWNGSKLAIGPGIHDSSAALAPYLYLMDEQFMLISTGTWSICLNPFNGEPLTFEELERDCLCYMNVHGDQVKASRLFLGSEYMHQKQKMESYFDRESTEPGPELDTDLLKKLIAENKINRKLQLEKAHSSGPHPQSETGSWDLSHFSGYSEAYHQLVLDLVSIQADSIKLAEGSREIEKLIITGGFSQNDFFSRLLASRFPDKKVYTASLPHASALGAAMVIDTRDGFENEVQKELLNLKQHEPLPGTGIENYSWKGDTRITRT